MESDPSRDRPSDPVGSLSASQARTALDRLNIDGVKLAERVVTPWWYHLILGLIVALFAGSQSIPGPASLFIVALGIIAIPALTTAYSQRYGISTSQPAGPRSRRLLFMAVGVLTLTLIAGLAIKFTGVSPWWGLLPAVVAFVLTVVLGRRYDGALRSELARNADGRV